MRVWTLMIAIAANSFATAQDAGPQWTLVEKHAAFSPRDTAEGVVYRGKMWLSNGYYHDNTVSRDLWQSDDGVHWHLINAATPYDPYTEMVVYKDMLWAVKGTVWNSHDGMKWNPVCPKTPFGLKGYSEVVVFRDLMWHLGTTDEVWNTGDGAHWTCAAEHAPYGERYAAAITVFRDKIWLMGGSMNARTEPPEKNYPGMTTYNDVWCSGDGAEWTRVSEHAPWNPRMWHAAFVFANKLWVIGGFDNRHGNNLGDVWQTEDGVTWQEFKAKDAFAPRHEVTLYDYKNHLWLVGGNTWPVVNDVWRLDGYKP